MGEESADASQAAEESRGRRGRWLVALFGSSVVVLLFLLGSVWLRLASGPERAGAPAIADVSSERLLAVGSVVGIAAGDETHAWLGIPYARPPVGPLRWRAPLPPAAWVDPFDALAFGPPCVQLASRWAGFADEAADGLVGQEDCLTLNVWAPRMEPDAVPTGAERLPVMVFLHGGGHRAGHAGLPTYDGARLASRERVVVVTFNYRLGPFGWLAHPALRAEAGDAFEASGNFGTLDQIAALRWVARHVSDFGGDPGRVTVFGESTGGTDVLALLLAEPARGLFQGAILQSATLDSVSRIEAEAPFDPEDPAAGGQRHSAAETVVSLIERAGVVPDRAAARGYVAELPDADLRAFLRGRTPEEVLDVYRSPEQPGRLEVPTLIRDGRLLPEGDWLDALARGRFHRVPVLLGSNRDEWKLFLARDEAHVRRTLGLFYRILDPVDYERRARHHSELRSLHAVDAPARAMLEAGHRAVHAYRFDWDEMPRLFGVGVELSRLLGAARGLELPFVFGQFRLGDPWLDRAVWSEETRASREALAERMMGYWAEFARRGSPGRGGAAGGPEWPAWVDETGRPGALLVLDGERDGGIRVDRSQRSLDRVIAAVEAEPGLDRGEKCALFHDLFARGASTRDEAVGWPGERACESETAEAL